MTRHGRDCPRLCSLCAGAVPRVVTQSGADITIDGKPVRPIAPLMTDAQLKYARRGAKRK